SHGPVSFSKDDESLALLFKKTSTHFFMSEFNMANVAAAAAIARRVGVSDDAIKKALAGFRGVPGRAEFITHGPYTAAVDYAHTPDSLEAIYKSVKPAKKGARLICILGAAGGGRDRWKRPAMGKIAVKYCDEIILTDEDPYDEDPREIVREIEAGIREADS